MSNMNIGKKLTCAFFIVAVLTGAAIGIFAEQTAERNGIHATHNMLEAINKNRATELNSYLSSIGEDLSIMARNEYIRQALFDFSLAWKDFGGKQKETLHKLYIDDNIHETGEKHLLDYANDGSSYSSVHKKYHPWLRHFLVTRDYYDVFLFNPQGDLVYSVFKELDYATNLNTGKWKETDLGNAFRAARDNPTKGHQTFFDFKPYAPSFDVPASFISEPILNKSGKLAGVLVFQMPIVRINNIMNSQAGLGETGQTYLVGEDGFFRSNSRFNGEDDETSILNTKTPGTSYVKAFENSGEEAYGVDVTTNAKGNTVFSAYAPVEFKGTKWALLAELDEAEATLPIAILKKNIIIGASVVSLFMGLLGFLISRSLSTPITKITGTMQSLADGDHSVVIEGSGRGDEIGKMAQAVEVFKENAIEQVEAKGKEVERIAADEKQKHEMMQALANNFESKVMAVVDSVSAASNTLIHTAESMANSVDSAGDKAQSAVHDSETTSQNVQMVASAAEELSASVSEIAGQLAKTTSVVNISVESAESADSTTQELSIAAERIGAVVGLIKDIAEQINLLALNATIESARAGDAGKGFAVVASEVKNLADQASKAVDEIEKEVNSIQDVSKNVVTVLKTIKDGVANINEYTNNVSAAVEEQSATTQEIASNMQTASTGVAKVVANITDVTASTSAASVSSSEVLQEARNLSEQAESLRGQVGSFIAEIKAS
jgi:methyl-accepting chemotaxis protein